MKPPVFTYHDPRTVQEAVELLAKLESARLLAGGQSLMPMLNFRVVRPNNVIDLNRITALSGISIDGVRITIGAMTRQAEIERSSEIAERCPLLQEELRHVGHRQTRNRGTIGGSLAHMDPAAELPIVALALRADLHVQSGRGTRTIGMDEFPVSYMTTALQPDELLIAMSFDAWPHGHAYAFEEFSRRRGDFAIVAAAVLLRVESGLVRNVSVVVGGIGPRPVRLREVEQAMIGRRPDLHLAAAAAKPASSVEAHSDLHASARYRQRLAEILVQRAIARAFSRIR